MTINETESQVDLADIRQGWRAVMGKTYWKRSLPGVEGVELECVGPIKPEKNPNFKPDRFKFRLPQDFENIELGGKKIELGGKIIVFSAEDVNRWIAPDPDSPTSFSNS